MFGKSFVRIQLFIYLSDKAIYRTVLEEGDINATEC